MERTRCASLQDPFKVTVVEVGAGHGKLSLLMARAFAQQPLAYAQIKVICSDFHAALFEEQLLPLPWIQVEIYSNTTLSYSLTYYRTHSLTV